MRTPVAPVKVVRWDADGSDGADDLLVSEEPLEIRLGHGPEHARKEFQLSVTMRTPGHDTELATGFLITEGIVQRPEQLLRVAYCENVKEDERGNVVRAELHPDVEVDRTRWQRNFYTSSSCGVCGKSSIDAVFAQCPRLASAAMVIDPAVITALPQRMREAQTVFQYTGGIHAAALFDRKGELLLLREDVGRHNAVDKVIGAALTASLPLNESVLLVSGRAGFELVQKCVMAGIPWMTAIGAPSSLAVQLARESGLGLIGFLRGDRFNVYAPLP